MVGVLLWRRANACRLSGAVSRYASRGGESRAGKGWRIQGGLSFRRGPVRAVLRLPCCRYVKTKPRALRLPNGNIKRGPGAFRILETQTPNPIMSERQKLGVGRFPVGGKIVDLMPFIAQLNIGFPVFGKLFFSGPKNENRLLASNQRLRLAFSMVGGGIRQQQFIKGIGNFSGWVHCFLVGFMFLLFANGCRISGPIRGGEGFAMRFCNRNR